MRETGDRRNIHGFSVSFTYTPNGLRQTMSDVPGTTTYGCDNRNRVTSKQTPFGTLSYTYDAASNLLTLKSSNSGGISDTYTYDTLNRLSTVTDASGTTTYAYDGHTDLGSTMELGSGDMETSNDRRYYLDSTDLEQTRCCQR